MFSLGFKIKYFFFILFSANLSASPLSEIDKSLSNLFKADKVSKVSNNPEILDFNEICHKKLDQYLSRLDKKKLSNVSSCLKTLSPELTIDKLTAALNQDQLGRFLAREQIPLYEGFLKSCHSKLSEFHGDIQKFTAAAYDLSFVNPKKPKSISTPKGYSVTKFYGNQPLSCYNSGFKAAMFSPQNDGDHVIFAIAGTEASPNYSDGTKRETFKVKRPGGFLSGGKLKDVELTAEQMDKEDWSTKNDGATGRKQAATKCAKELVKDAIRIAKKQNKKIIFTGHSLGGALSQGLSYQVTKELQKKKIETEVQSVNFMPAAGYFTVPEKDRSEKTRNKVLAINYVSEGDIVSTTHDNFISKTGPHLGEMRYMDRKKEIVEDYLQRGKAIEKHSLMPECYGPLGCSEHTLGQELTGNFYRYNGDLATQRKEILEMRKLLEADNKEEK